MPSIRKANQRPSEQSARFIEAAKKIEADESGKKFERALKRIVKADKPRKR